jgi:SulP family sulfate permease
VKLAADVYPTVVGGQEVLAGLTVSFALVPEATAFAFVAGVNPLVALYGASIMPMVTSLFGGRPGMISGAAGATVRASSPIEL